MSAEKLIQPFHMTYREIYRAAVFMVAAAMTKPRIPTARGIAMCQNRSPVLSECLKEMIQHIRSIFAAAMQHTDLVTANATKVAKIHGYKRV
jgi:hypothetical protein